ncbi:MAG: glycoside hydrolase family 31 protein [Candidatus Eremiobacteraeota bacterium]|nr:glycoside hydrolase family 31 protein [Candidatus Eremiobacteraeota bacterium]
MRFIERATGISVEGQRCLVTLDHAHLLSIEGMAPGVVRLLLTPKHGLRLNRTWSIARGASAVPWEGLPRADLDGPRETLGLDSDTLKMGDIALKINREPYHLQWFFRGKEMLSERKTGAVALGRRDNRLWHFHKLRQGSRFYGLGERTGEIDRRGRSFEMRNVDPMGYDARTTDPMYKHVPFYIEHHENGYVGLFYDNYATATFNLGQEIDNYHGPFTSYRAADGDLDLYLFFFPTLLEVVQAFSRLTGHTYFPPKWSLGYSTTSMTYTDVENAQQRIERFLQEADKHQIPVKSFKYGSGYTSREGKRYVFTWNSSKFPDPKGLSDAFHKRGIRLNANIKPVLLHDHPLYEEAKPLFIRDSDEDLQEVSCFWDDFGSHLDFTNPSTVGWWKKKVKEQLLDYGIDATWNDNNEYVIWDDEARCHGFGEQIPISLIRPLMSLWMTRASHEIVQAQSPNRRVWSISRCGCPGLQRYAQTWSGDNYTCWETLEYNNKMALGLSLSGIYNIGHDTGGFSGPPPEPELLARWFFIGAFTPRFGVNSWKPDGTITEPWMHPEVLPAVKRALGVRMRFMPQLYSLMKDSCDNSVPLLRPTFLNFPQDPNCLQEETEFMWGDSLLIAPVTEPGVQSRRVYLPHSEHGWWCVWSGRFFEGGRLIEVPAPLDSVPLFARGGSALFLADWGVDSIDGPEDFREIHLFPGADFQANFYDDDGETYDYLKDGFLEMKLAVEQRGKVLRPRLTTEGNFRPPYRRLKFVVPGGFEVEPAEIEL